MWNNAANRMTHAAQSSQIMARQVDGRGSVLGDGEGLPILSHGRRPGVENAKARASARRMHRLGRHFAPMRNASFLVYV